MEVLEISTPNSFHTSDGNVKKIGFDRQIIYIAHNSRTKLEIWKLNCLIPNSWQRVYYKNFKELSYSYFSFSKIDMSIYALLVAVFEVSTEYEAFILKIDRDQKETFYFLNKEQTPNFFMEIPLERIGMGALKTLYIYDRSMVMGQIPFWRIHIQEDKKTFSIKSKPIKGDESWSIVRFPVIINGDQRMILRITTSNQLIIYKGAEEKWIELVAESDTHLDLTNIPSRGVSETYGRDFHRYSAIESALTVFSESGQCIFKLLEKGKHKFFKLLINENDNTYRLQQYNIVKLTKQMETLFYLNFTDTRLAFVNKHRIGFANIQPLTLKEISFWKLQCQFAFKDYHSGLWKGGKTEEELLQIFCLNYKKKLL